MGRYKMMCPECDNNNIKLKAHENETWACPECNYWYCNDCGEEWDEELPRWR